MENRTIKRVIDGKLVKITLTIDEVSFLVEQKEKQNILTDYLKRLHEYYDVNSESDELIKKDLDIIYKIFKKVEDSNLSYWENIDKTIDYLKDMSSTNFNYNSI